MSGRSLPIEDLLANHNTESILEALIVEKVTVLIYQEIFALGYKVTREMGIEVYKTGTPYLETTISMFKNGALSPFSFGSAKTNVNVPNSALN